MKTAIFMLIAVYMVFLIIEHSLNNRRRKTFKHVIHVNGTRGKSSTCRLIYAGLKAGGYKVFCKTTGTSARTIDVRGREKEITRWGSPNIKEQIKVFKEAEKQGAEIVVIECMAVDPYLQYISQHKILKADISIVTNVREDHIEEMGSSLEEIGQAMGNVIPKSGYFVTADENFFDYYKLKAKMLGSKAIFAKGNQVYSKIDFSENVAIALEICRLLKVDENKALTAMENYQRDPGALKIYKLNKSSGKETLFINGFALNDPESTMKVYLWLKDKGLFNERKFIIIVNNRKDRPYRVRQHINVLKNLAPQEVWLCGSHQHYMRNKLIKNGFSIEQIKFFKTKQLNLWDTKVHTTIFGIGNVQGCGDEILGYVEKEGELLDL